MSFREDRIYENEYNYLVNTMDETYLVQGEKPEEDEESIYMVRNIADLLECERNPVQELVWRKEQYGEDYL